jgi:sarcosine oxidase subunit alpha
VSVAMLTAGKACRVSVSGEPRTALCGMGICFECRAVVNGVAYTRTCQLMCSDGMRVETQR